METNNNIYALDLFKVIYDALSQIHNINKSWIKASAGSKPIHFTKLDSLPESEKVNFVQTIVLNCGELDSTTMRGIERKQQSSSIGFIPIEIHLSFESDKQKRKYFGYKYAQHGIIESKNRFAEA